MSVDQKGDMCPSPSGKEAKTTPRMPKPETEARLLHGGGPSASEMPKTTLSVNAPVFVPKNYPPEPPQEQECISQEFEQMSMRADAQEVSYLLNEFTRTMAILLTNPGNMIEYMRPLCEKLRSAETEDILHEVILILYEQSITEPNFRYTGARVCHYITSNLKDHAIFSRFRAEFLKRCNVDYTNREQLLMNEEEGLHRLCGLTLFMGELFLNYTAAGSEKMEFLPKVLTDLLRTLLSQPTDITVKTVCQLLKLAGGPTEDMVNVNPTDAKNFHEVFITLSQLQDAPCISSNMKHLVKSVLNLRQSKWGRGDPASPPSLDAHSNRLNLMPPNFMQAEPVFYDMNGKPISREEAGYREEEEEEEEDPENQYILSEEEEQEFLAWQAEVQGCAPNPRSFPAQIPSHQGTARPPRDIHLNNMSYQDPCIYQAWSTSVDSVSYQENYYNDYADNGYAPYNADNVLAMNEEEEAAYEEFLSQSYQLNQMGKR
ncbi:polyadenylate-binding protein-interacting protein 1-like isoform X2 [Pomacea canaliculata]|uniref:polyadenylate-binding protein-interacting protein 1-like isoform X2 n=1 Tax=Pomacea canaliculata TaxID=400727 RepID=UPI000D73A615|nr:polyadenylate-binding protein-interacting protein 1-like isoform X2 [Pomacea canaliculata]